MIAVATGWVKAKSRESDPLEGIDGLDGRQRAFVKVQDGCDAFCTYCVVPFTRSRVWSRRDADVLDECRRLVAAGHREIVLCGVFLGAFGRATARRRRWPVDVPAPLAGLVAAVADIPGLWRFRLSSLEPGDLSDELLEVCRSSPKFAPHFHLPLQSGSSRVLRGMNRQYDADDYAVAVDRARAAIDRVALTTDVIVGFPGESDDDFAATLAMARRAGFAKIHAFPFSAMGPAAAWQWRHEAPPPEVVRRRMSDLSEVEAATARQYRRLFVGDIMEALVERSRSAGRGQAVAMTDRYFRVSFDAPPGRGVLPGDLVRLKVTDATSERVEGAMQAEP
jgi:threonylcarbamoyladenosine tRNA methylthiotransferase MtaB